VNLIQRFVHALRPAENRLVVARGSELKQQAETVRAEAEQMVEIVNRNTESGIWPQDMIRGVYRVKRRAVRREHP
jgi:hypothetical protein